ncbi:hypothetical protein TOT_010001162 [Theileria orientalis strain Shintoku]|uniref:Uncharacterized protein n=1 Tax=Theileria orientalis strain Shintoku TaxID=869250 RepID=J4C7V7_THEOR|nr:hypothetical protein TOT_010001162 [Theileria orientalis strain Shintoku]PVC52480.1 hypothetical protein MACL_00000734 [Theileria orientalis]BAM39708.1 hypothetical protein TOT_010001162 [Theileria orientalis strain Shintoku]|eukprot:XP_009690009.1 hypothetical protein TOT_010001162 [Theileria orientalis strain Shintoku]
MGKMENYTHRMESSGRLRKACAMNIFKEATKRKIEI